MKTMLLLISILVLSSFKLVEKHTPIYYFCTSRTLSTNKDGKIIVLLTKIKKTEQGEDYIDMQTSKWSHFVNKKNVLKCTSDLNLYKDSLQAKDVFNKINREFSDTSKYQTTFVEL
ncbi:MAG: hypothetical protein DI598_08185 [Pseudopedobacter saltans]|uniref:Uncharacterized protein n=1 Tax=Pseudopedobacter saltans TaxID=151895 RepID=A0A2W5GU02_9SPHI|nr:MAG: hypothetical protein DI598_08185 [Pseudopedobacter saltans]